nr:hypothetical protein [Tanacetum cinerariifolium]
MNPITTQHAALDNALVPSEKRLKIERCNARIAFSKPQKEETYQFWNTIKKIGKTYGYNFKLDKKKCRVDTKVFCEILQICPRIPNQDFVELLSEEDLLTLIKELGYFGKCDMLSTLRTDQMHQPWRTFVAATRKVPLKKSRKFKKPASPKLKTVPSSLNQPTQKGKRVKRAAKKATTAPTTGVVIKDTSVKSVSKKKAPAKIGRGKGIKLLSDGALLEEAQMKKTLKRRKTKDTSEGAGKKLGVLDVSKDDSSDSNNDSWGDSEDESNDDHDKNDLNKDDNDDEDDNDDDDGNDDSGNDDDSHNHAQDSKQTDSDDKEKPSFTLKDYEEEEDDEEYVFSLEKDKSDDEEKMFEEEDDDVAKDLDGDLNITQGLRYRLD